MKPLVSVVLPSHNSRADHLAASLAALRGQTLDVSDWDLVVVDNKSQQPLEGALNLAWHPRSRIVREETLGLTRARLRGFAETRGEVVVLVDDDNVLAPNYLEEVARIVDARPYLGAWGGVIRPRYEDAALAPPTSLLPLLTVRDAPADSWSNDTGHHASTPWGAGLCVRRAVADTYQRELAANPDRAKLDLQGRRLLYGGDTDIAFTACRLGLGKGVLIKLALEHLIPASRCSREYLCKVSEGRGYSEVLHEYLSFNRLPPPDSLATKVRRWVRGWRATSIETAVIAAHQRGREAATFDLRPG